MGQFGQFWVFRFPRARFFDSMCRVRSFIDPKTVSQFSHLFSCVVFSRFSAAICKLLRWLFPRDKALLSVWIWRALASLSALGLLSTRSCMRTIQLLLKAGICTLYNRMKAHRWKRRRQIRTYFIIHHQKSSRKWVSHGLPCAAGHCKNISAKINPISAVVQFLARKFKFS